MIPGGLDDKQRIVYGPAGDSSWSEEVLYIDWLCTYATHTLMIYTITNANTSTINVSFNLRFYLCLTTEFIRSEFSGSDVVE